MRRFRPGRDLISLRLQLPLLLLIYCFAVGVILYIAADRGQQARFDENFARNLGVAMLSVFMAALGLSVTLHFLVTRRIEKLHTVMRRFASGHPVDDQKPRGAPWADEISQVHGHFISVATAIGRETAVRRQAEDALRESEERFRSAMHHSPIGMALVAPDARFLEVNPALCAIVGYTREEMLATTFKALTHPDDLPNDMAAMSQMLSHEVDTIQTTKRYFHKDGRVLWILLHSSLVEDDAQRPRHFVTQILDITESKRADEELQHANRALRDSQSKLVMAMDMAGLAHWELDVNRRLFTFDQRVFTQLGTTTERESGPTMPAEAYIEKFVPAEDRHVFAEEIAKAEQTTDSGYTGQFEHRIRRADGLIAIVQVRSAFEKDAAGHVVRVYGANQDITERKRAAAEVVAMNDRYARQEAALTMLTRSYVSAPDDFTPIVREITEVVARTLGVGQVGVWRHDDRGTSSRCQDLFEWPELRHSSGMELSEEACPAFFKSLAAADIIAAHDALNDGRTSELAGPYLSPQQVTSMMSVPIRSQGVAVGVLSCMHKSTPRRWTPDEQTFALAVANLLSALIAQVERQRLEQQLRQAQKLEAIGQLAGGVAHDFNNILTVILGRAEGASLDPRLPVDLQTAMSDISQNAERATALTRQLLAFSRRQPIQVRDVDMNAVVSNLTRMLDRILGEDVVVDIHYAAEPVHVRADPGMIEQVLLNLAVNARDAMPVGGQLTIVTSVVESPDDALRGTPPPGTWVCLQVTDRGSGIAAEDLPHIFEPFFTTKDVGKGTGLGLATTYGIVQQHGGWIEVDSQVSRGTTFRVFFPQLTDALVAPVAASPGPAASPRGDETILVVEDEEGVRALVISVLEHLGYHLLEAQSGPSAIEVWREHGPGIDMLITDIVMPDGMNGVELAEHLRLTSPGLKVIYTSGYLADVSHDDIPSRDTDAFLPKPFSLPELARLVRRTLDVRESV